MVEVESTAYVAATGTKEDAHVTVRWLCSDGWGEDGKEVIGGEVVDHLFFFYTVNCGPALAVFGRHNICAENDNNYCPRVR